MKYLAILKDSLREAIDTKVFYVTVGLSCVLVLLVASVSFRPVTVEDSMKQFTGQLTWIFNLATQGRAPRYDVVDFRQTNDAAEPWRGDYRFTILVQFASPEDVERARKQGLPLTGDKFKELLEEAFYWLEDVHVLPTKSADANELRFLVSTHGTKITNRRDWPHEPRILFAVPLPWFRSSLSGTVYWVEDKLVNGFGAWIGIMVGVVITAFFIPNMLRKGTVDLLLAKPIHRSTLLLYKYVGGLSFVFLNAGLVVCGMWLVLGLRSGIWATGFLLTVFIITFFFAILYGVSTLFAVLTRSPVVCILVTVVVWLLLALVGWTYQFTEGLRRAEDRRELSLEDVRELAAPTEGVSDKWWFSVIRAVHFVLPRTNDLDVLTTRLLSRQLLSEAEIRHRRLDKAPPITWAESLTVSGVFITVMLGLACWWFATKDY